MSRPSRAIDILPLVQTLYATGYTPSEIVEKIAITNPECRVTDDLIQGWQRRGKLVRVVEDPLKPIEESSYVVKNPIERDLTKDDERSITEYVRTFGTVDDAHTERSHDALDIEYHLYAGMAKALSYMKEATDVMTVTNAAALYCKLYDYYNKYCLESKKSTTEVRVIFEEVKL